MNKSLYVDSSSIDLENQFFKKGTPLTMLFYIKMVESSGDRVIISQNIDRASSGRLTIRVATNGKPSFYIGGNSPESVYGSSDMPLNEWCYMAVVFDGETLYFYMNNKLETSVKVNVNFQNDNTWLASYARGTANYFKGYIDDFRIYNYAMSLDEIIKKDGYIENNLYNLLVYYNFNELIEGNKIENIVSKTNVTVNNLKYLSHDAPILKSRFKYLINQNNNYYSTYNNYLKLGQPTNLDELDNWFKDYGTNSILNLQDTLTSKKIPMVEGAGNIYESLDVDLNDLKKEDLYIIEEDSKTYFEYDYNNYKIIDEIRKVNGGIGNVMFKED